MKALDPLAVPLAGTTLVEASAGTGKTHAITTLFVRLLLERGLQVSEILVVTYTRAATAELRDRLRNRLLEAIDAIDRGEPAGDGGDEDLLDALVATRRRGGNLAADRLVLVQALRDFDEAAVFTIHGFCQRTLTEHAFESRTPFELELVEQQAPLLHEVALDYFARVAYQAEPPVVEALVRGGAKPVELEKLVAAAVHDPRVPVLPEAGGEAELPLAAFEAARDHAAALWREHSEEILDELFKAGRLNGNMYREQTVRGQWARGLQRLHAASLRSLPEWIDKLTNARLRASMNKAFRSSPPPRHAFFDAVDALQSAVQALRPALDQRVLATRRRLIDYARQEVARRHAERGEQSFDDLLNGLHDALQGAAGSELAARIRRRHPAALIDEFQDTDPVQYAIFRRIYAQPSDTLFLIGDPKQAIYGFRGADIFAYMQAAREAGRARYTLDINRRADPGLVRAVNTLLSRAPRPFWFEEIPFAPVSPAPAARERLSGGGASLQLLLSASQERARSGVRRSVGDPRDLPDRIAYEIVRLLQSGETLDGEPLRPRHLAVLCRANYQARDTQAALARLRVPAVLDGDSSVFESEMASELSRVLWAIARPADARKLGAALCTSILGADAEALHALHQHDAELETWLDRFARLNQLWHERGFVQMLHLLLDETSAQRKLLSCFDGERRLTDLLHLVELLHQAALQQHLGPLSLLQWLTRMRVDSKARAEMASESTQIRLEHDEHALKLTTVHRSKGLEYPIVFCPFMWWVRSPKQDEDALFHDRDDHDRVKLDIGSADRAEHLEQARVEAKAESLRLLYVALTRAKHRCYVVWGPFKGGGQSPLGHLLHGSFGNGMPGTERTLENLDPAELRAELQGLCDASEGSIGMREIGLERPPVYAGGEQAAGPLAAREAKRKPRPQPRSSSFSRLTAEQAVTPGSSPEDERDLDQGVESGGNALDLATEIDREPLVLHAFPSGSRPGSLIHAVYEQIDFGRADPAELPAQAERLLGLYGLDAQHAGALVRGIEQSLRTPLGPDGARRRLADVRRAQRLDELEFTLSTPHAREDLSARLADALQRHAAPAAVPDYPERLRMLRMLPPSGFLKGFIDLVFRDGERFFVVDYKSNRLGDVADDYRPARLALAMAEHHYFLQYHLYVLALHRHLRLRLPDYAYERHFGGVYYLFVRGMAPEHAPGTGVFFDRPSEALIEALSRALGAQEEPP